MIRSHFSPASTSSFRIVPWWTPVMRSTLETLFPSSKSERTISAFSIGRYMPSSGVSWASVKVLEHWQQRKRRSPLRCFPKRWHSVRQLWHVTLDLNFLQARATMKRGIQTQSHGFGLRLNPVGSFNYLPDFSFYGQPQRGRKKSLLGSPGRQSKSTQARRGNRWNGNYVQKRLCHPRGHSNPPKRRLGAPNVLLLNITSGHHTAKHHDNRSAGIVESIQGVRNRFQFIYYLSDGDMPLVAASLQRHPHNVGKPSVFKHRHCYFGDYRRLGRQRSHKVSQGLNHHVVVSNFGCDSISLFRQLLTLLLRFSQQRGHVRLGVFLCH